MALQMLATSNETYLRRMFGKVQPANLRQPAAGWLAANRLWVNASVPSGFWRLFRPGILQYFA
jgi:hypothetical protein